MIGRVVLPLALAVLGACSPQPRSASYFEAHQDEAEEVAAACRTGAHRGLECVNAQAGVGAAKRDARMDAYRKGF
ncbi:MAG: EexN family lipoprotein [Phenylobacterium sp.]|uniref:EexN family lipoprotein n=1 Tax=Phenylobacterium sp. TaxID=1871053 RepID=UPI001B628E0F|nr:EexN family lipoprotein [Phenylobacterium sp.]MBP7817091.1 EexN family lipoprotein [Phenylobacterium sp.]